MSFCIRSTDELRPGYYAGVDEDSDCNWWPVYNENLSEVITFDTSEKAARALKWLIMRMCQDDLAVEEIADEQG